MRRSRALSGGRGTTVAVALALTALVAGGTTARAGEPASPDQNEVYVEVMGNTILGANYVRGVSNNLSLRVGAGVVPQVGSTALVMPTLHLNRKSKHDIEVGAGAQEVWYEDGQAHSMLGAAGGYRFRSDGGFTVRVVGSLFVGKPTGKKPSAGFGVSFGKTF